MTVQQNQNRIWLPILIIVGGIAVWGILLALGAYLGLTDEAPNFDARRAGIMLAATGGFLLFWLAALALRSRRLKHEKQQKNQDSGDRPA